MNILFFGGHYWDRGPWFRKQQFASRFLQRGHRVFYIEDAPSMIRRKKNSKNLLLKTYYKKINDNLVIITPSSIFPFPSNFYTRGLYNKKLMFDIKRILKKENAKDYILWTNKIEISSVLLKEKKIKILDVCDDIPFYFKLAGDEKGYRSSLKFFESAFSKTDIQIVSALKIKEKYMHLTNKEIIVIPNGHNIKIKINNTAIPAEVEKIPSPRIGFLGTLFRFIDDELLAYLIKSRPSYNYVFVGDVDDSFPINKIKNYKNVFLLGKKDKDMIPRYINSFDVCLNPFKVHEVNDSVNPVKVFEYLALQKKVISTFMYSLMKEKIADYILFARDREEFLKILDKTILESNFLNPLPSGLISEYHWDNLFENLILNLKEKKIYL